MSILAPAAGQVQPPWPTSGGGAGAPLLAHPAMPKSTAKRGTRRMPPRLRSALRQPLAKDEALEAIRTGALLPDLCTVLWNIDEVPVAQPILDVVVPSGLSLRPVRRIGTYKGARNRIGMYPVHRDGHALMLCAESRLEMSWFRAADIDPRVSWIAAQPFVLVWPLGDRALVRICDLLIRFADGWLVADVKPDDLLARDPYARAVMAFTRRTLALAGLDYAVLGDMSLQRTVNLRAITRYRQPNYALGREVARMVDGEPRTAGGVLLGCGDHIGREVLMHLLAMGRCRAHLDEPIHRATVLTWLPPRAVDHLDLDRAVCRTGVALGENLTGASS